MSFSKLIFETTRRAIKNFKIEVMAESAAEKHGLFCMHISHSHWVNPVLDKNRFIMPGTMRVLGSEEEVNLG